MLPLYNTGMAKALPLITAGQRYGRWTTLENQKYTFTREILCKCDCGNKRTVDVSNLNQGHSNSCGCINREMFRAAAVKRRKHQLNPGDIYGRLTVTDATDYKAVICRCECGNTTVCTAGSLYRGGTKSCGCLRLELIQALGRKYAPQNGNSTHPLYKTWQRITKGHHPVHKRWHTFTTFAADVTEEIGPRPKDALFKPKDPETPFQRGNIQWQPRSQQQRSVVRLNDDQKQEIIELVEAGCKHYEVAKEYKVSASYVSSLYRKHQQQ